VRRCPRPSLTEMSTTCHKRTRCSGHLGSRCAKAHDDKDAIETTISNDEKHKLEGPDLQPHNLI
jgi:hypothetical protein